jgi:hypothetical protein
MAFVVGRWSLFGDDRSGWTLLLDDKKFNVINVPRFYAVPICFELWCFVCKKVNKCKQIHILT